MNHRTLSLLLLLGMTTLDCSNPDSVNIGETTGSNLSDYAASWDGYAEAFQFESGSDRMRLTLDGNGNGTLRVGDLPLFPPPTDPNVGYPQGPWDLSNNGVVSTLKPGFLYSLHQSRIENNRIRLGVDFREIYQPWCELQTPVLSDNTDGYLCAHNDLAACTRIGATPSTASQSYLCMHSWNTNIADPIGQNCSLTDPTTMSSVPIDCFKMYLCGIAPPCTCEMSPTACVCTATSCSIPPVVGDYPVQIDAALEIGGSQMVGTLATNDGTRFTIRFTHH